MIKKTLKKTLKKTIKKSLYKTQHEQRDKHKKNTKLTQNPNIKYINSKFNKNKKIQTNKKNEQYLRSIENLDRISSRTHKYIQVLPQNLNNKPTSTHMLIDTLNNKNGNNNVKQKGGLFGIDSAVFKWNMNRFNKIITKLNKYDVNMQNEINAYTIQLKIFKERALDKATLLTELLNNYRQKIIFNIYENNEIINADTPSTIEKSKIINSNKILDTHILTLIKGAQQIDNEIGKDMPEYNRLIKSFNTKQTQFTKITSDYANDIMFITKIKELKRSYDTILEASSSSDTLTENPNNILSKADKAKLTKSQRAKIIQFEEHKKDYMNVIKMNDSELEKRRFIEGSLIAILKETEDYKAQFGTYKGTKKIKDSGALDTQMYGINCETGGLICDWRDKYNDFAEGLLDIIDNCKECIIKITIIYESIKNCKVNLATIVAKSDISRSQEQHASSMILMEKDINELKDLFEAIKVILIEFKFLFYDQKPASQLLNNYNEIIMNLNYIELKLSKYNTIFESIEELKNKDKDKLQAGGASGASSASSASSGGTTSATSGTSGGTTSGTIDTTTSTTTSTTSSTDAKKEATATIKEAKKRTDAETKTNTEANAKTSYPQTQTKAIEAYTIPKTHNYTDSNPISKDEISAFKKICLTLKNKENLKILHLNESDISVIENTNKDIYKLIETLNAENSNSFDTPQIYNIVFRKIIENFKNCDLLIKNNNESSSHTPQSHISIPNIKKHNEVNTTNLKSIHIQLKQIQSHIQKLKDQRAQIDIPTDKPTDKTLKVLDSKPSSDKIKDFISKINKIDYNNKDNPETNIKAFATVIQKEINPPITTKTDLPINPSLIKDILRFMNKDEIVSNYSMEKENITRELKTIKNELSILTKLNNNTTNTSNPIKTITNLIRTLVNILGDIKIIEPKIVAIKVDTPKPVVVEYARWIVKQADKEFNDERPMASTKALEALRIKNTELKIPEAIETTSAEIYKLILHLRITITGKTQSNIIDNLRKEFKDVEEFKKLDKFRELVAGIKKMYPPPIEKDKFKIKPNAIACKILQNIRLIIGYNIIDDLPQEISKLFTDTEMSYGYCPELMQKLNKDEQPQNQQQNPNSQFTSNIIY